MTEIGVVVELLRAQIQNFATHSLVVPYIKRNVGWSVLYSSGLGLIRFGGAAARDTDE